MYSRIFLLFSFFTINANAACWDMAELHSSSLYINISDGGCGEMSISFTSKINSDGQPDWHSLKKYPFNEECVFTYYEKNVSSQKFSCHSGGRTPLAGATFEMKRVGHIIENCGEPGEKPHKSPAMQYVCTKGCKANVPKAFDKVGTCS